MCGKDRCRCGGCCCCSEGGCGCGGGCGCSCGGGGFTRRYQTKAEEKAELEDYLKDLEAEVQAVKERLADLRRRK